MRPSDNLFKLIQSLSASEKRYFKIYAEQHIIGKKNNYMQLFDMIAKQTEYDEAAIKRKFRREKFIRQLTFTKNTLTHKIMKALRSFQEGSKNRSEESELRDLLHDLDILYQKELLDQFKKELKRSKKIAYRVEEFLILLRLLAWEKKYVIEQSTKKTEQKLKAVIEEEEEVMQLLRNQMIYYNLSKQILTSLRTKVSDKKKKELQELKALVQHPLLQSEAQATTFMSKTYYHDTLGLYHWKMGDLQKAYTHYEQLVDLWESDAKSAAQDNMLYRQSLGNYLNVCHAMGQDKMGMFPFILKKIKSLPKGNLETQIKTFQLTVHHELLYYLNTGKFEEGTKVVKKIEAELRTLEQQLPTSELLSIYYNISIIYFFSEDFTNTLLWLNEILSHPRTDVRKDIQQFAKILQFIIHYELDNEEILENLYRSVYRSLKKEEQLHEFEQLVLNYIRKLLVINPFEKKVLNECYNEFGEAISTMQAKPDYIHILGAQETIIWVVSKLQETTMGEVFRKATGITQ
ncbi:MAG: hypothetical protein R3E32_12385 [Chitinophagales bacterium]